MDESQRERVETLTEMLMLLEMLDPRKAKEFTEEQAKRNNAVLAYNRDNVVKLTGEITFQEYAGGVSGLYTYFSEAERRLEAAEAHMGPEELRFHRANIEGAKALYEKLNVIAKASGLVRLDGQFHTPPRPDKSSLDGTRDGAGPDPFII
jgi:hypothetical protein